MNEVIHVTKPALAPLSEFKAYLERIWDSGVMTHNGPLLHELERELRVYLDLKDIVCVSNGTVALQLAIRALNLTGEIITTPFSFIATSNIIAWEHCTPVFADIDPYTWNMDPSKISAAITANTSAVLPVHVFSNPCQVHEIDRIAQRHQLKVIYDAAHAMAVKVAGKSIMEYGDISCLSFHATKLFNTGEGGACVAPNEELCRKLRRLRFFGFDENKDIVDEGMNGKMTEISAGLGLANLKWLDAVRVERQASYHLYQAALSNVPGLRFQQFTAEEYNYSYMPVVFESEAKTLAVLNALGAQKIFARRYFYPSLNTLEIYQNRRMMPVAEDIARKVLCLPLYYGLPQHTIKRVCDIIHSTKL